MQRVEQRAQVRVDLRHQVAGQEAEALAGLDGRAGEDDAVDLAALQRGGGHGDGQERLAGAGRADAEGDRVAADRVDVALLVDRLGRDLAWSGGARRRRRGSRAGDSCASSAPVTALDRAGRDLVTLRRRARPSRARPARRRATASGSPSSVTHVAAQEEVAVEVTLQRLEHRVLAAGQLGGDVVGELDLAFSWRSDARRRRASLTCSDTRRPSARPATLRHDDRHDPAHVLRRGRAGLRHRVGDDRVRSSSSDSSAGR